MRAVELHFSVVVSLGKRILTFYSVKTVSMKVHCVTIRMKPIEHIELLSYSTVCLLVAW